MTAWVVSPTSFYPESCYGGSDYAHDARQRLPIAILSAILP
jgi:hypothetical protein